MGNLRELQKTRAVERLSQALGSDGIGQTVARRAAVFLVGHKRTILRRDEFEDEFSRLSQQERSALLRALGEAGVLRPTKSGQDLFGSARLRIEVIKGLAQDEEEAAVEVYRGLNVALKANGYLRANLDILMAYKDELKQLSDWFAAPREARTVTRKERSYEIWGEEKLLEGGKKADGLGELIYTRMGLTDDDLRCCPTVGADFVYWMVPDDGLVVVSENKDFYVDLKSTLADGSTTICGMRVRGCILGAGHAVESAAFIAFVSEVGLRVDDLIYVGDIDVEGVSIQQRMEERGVRPFIELYAAMLRLHIERVERGRPCNNYEEEHRARCDAAAFARALPADVRGEAERVLRASIRVPQEILTRHDLAALE